MTTADPRLLVRQIAALDAAGRSAEAERMARDMLAAVPDSPIALNAMVMVLNRRGAYAEALPLAQQAVATSPRDPAFQSNLGNLLYRTGDLQGAEVAYRNAALLKPDDAELYHNLGIVRAALGRHEEALAAQRRAAKADPHYWPAGMELAKLLRAQGQDEDALSAYQSVISVTPGCIPAHREYNDLAWSLGHDITHLRSFDFARSVIGNAPDLLLAEAEFRLRLGDAQIAEHLSDLALRSNPGRADLLNAKARAIAMQRRFEDAYTLFEQAIGLDPAEIGYRHDLATALLQNRQALRARKILQQALPLAPLDQSTLACLSLADRMLGGAEHQRLVDLSLVSEIILPVPPGFVDAASFNSALAEDLASRHTHRAPPLDQTLRGGTQTPGSLFGSPTRTISLLQDAIEEALADYISQLPVDQSHPFLSRKSGSFDFAGSWSSRLVPGGFHTNHIHPSGWISSAYYVALPGSGAAHEGALQFGQSQFLLDQDEPLRIVRPEVGKLVLFPSYYWHGTIPFQSAGKRLTVAFDALPQS